jgi:hypothetical protein
MIFDIYGRFRLDVRRENDSWVVYHPEPGKRARVNEIVIPATMEVEEIGIYLDDIYHELAGPGQRVECI